MHRNWIREIILVMGVLKYYSHTLKTLYILILFILNTVLITRCNFLCSQVAPKPSRHNKSCSVGGQADTASAEVKEYFLFNRHLIWLRSTGHIITSFFSLLQTKEHRRRGNKSCTKLLKNPLISIQFPVPTGHESAEESICYTTVLLQHNKRGVFTMSKKPLITAEDCITWIKLRDR